MKRIKPILILMVCVSVLMLASCRTSPIYNVHDATIPAYDNTKLSLLTVEKTIVQSGAELGWVMKPVHPGLIEGTLNVRSHQAVVDITYDESSYSINYKSSMNLKQQGGQIHGRYNTWIKNLQQAIDRKLSTERYQ